MLVGKKLGPFLVDKQLGAGAMGTVYRASHEKTGKYVAIKLIAASLAGNEQAVARFEREIAILKQLDHPNIIKYVGSGRWHKTPFYIMEFVEGESLDRILERKQRLGWEDVVAIGKQLCAALQYSHDQGIIHRDLKPANLMVLHDGTVKLTDFGIAKDTDVTALTAANATLGTASYMSPEQCKGARDLTGKSDLYSMGIMFYELLTGRKPFQADNVMDMFRMHTSASFERPSHRVLDIPIWFDTLICELLEKDPDKRPANAAAVAKALDDIAAKMAALTSAGLDAATKRRIDRSAHAIKLSDIDKDLARTLLGKKKKTKPLPFYRTNAFTISAVAAIVLLLAAVFWFAFFRTPSAESLYGQAKQLLESSDPRDHREARDGPIEEFLRYYPDHQLARQMRAWRDQVDLERCERQMLNRRHGGFAPDEEPEKIAFAALDDEDAGKLAEARKRWESLVPLKHSGDKDQRKWGLVADKYLRLLDDVDQLDKHLHTLVQLERREGKPYQGKNEQEQLALQGLREEAANRGRARQAWEDLKKLAARHADRDVEQRRWYLLAARYVRALQSEGP